MTEQDNTVWSSMLAHLRQHHPAICRQWFSDLEPCGVAGGTLQLRAKSPLYRDYLRRECNDPFGDAARSVTGRLLTVRFLGPDDEVLAPPPPPKRATPIGEPPRAVTPLRPATPAANGTHPADAYSQPNSHASAQRNSHPAAVEIVTFPRDHGASPNVSQPGGARPGAGSTHSPVNGQAGTGPQDLSQPPSGQSSSHPMNHLVVPEPRVPLDPPRPRNVTPHSSASSLPDALIEHKGIPRDPSREDGPNTRPNEHASGEQSDESGDPREDSRDHSRDAARDYARDQSRDQSRDQARDHSRDHARDQSRDHGRDAARDVSRDQRRPSGPSRYESLVVNPDFCFENFVQCPGNRMALAACQAIATNPGRVYNPFFLHAAVGLGKTHLLQAICLRIAETNPRAMMYYTSCEGFVTQFFESVKDGEMSDFRHRFRDIDVLVIDDIHFLSKRGSSQEEFFHTFNALYHSQKQIILSCDAAPEDIPDIEDRLVSRFKWGLVTKIEPPIFETRVAILKTKAAIRGLTMPDDVAMFIASKLSRSIRELEGAVVKLHIQSAVEQREIDLEMAKEALGEALVQPKGEPTLQAIISAVTEFYGVRLTDLQSKGRQRSIALPRQVCMYLARRCTRHSLEEIGGFFGGRDHTTVMHAVETIDQRRNADSELDLLLRSLEDRVRNNRTS
jgi:chromosomal replication initiator protein